MDTGLGNYMYLVLIGHMLFPEPNDDLGLKNIGGHSHQLPCAALQGRIWKAMFPKTGCNFIKFP